MHSQKRRLSADSLACSHFCRDPTAFWDKIVPNSRSDMSRHALKFFEVREGLKRESITLTLLLESQTGTHTQHLPAFLWEGRKGLKLSTTGATAQEEKAEFVTVTYENIPELILLLHVHGGQASTLDIFQN